MRLAHGWMCVIFATVIRGMWYVVYHESPLEAHDIKIGRPGANCLRIGQLGRAPGRRYYRPRVWFAWKLRSPGVGWARPAGRMTARGMWALIHARLPIDIHALVRLARGRGRLGTRPAHPWALLS